MVTNLSQRATEPSKIIKYMVGDHCRCKIQVTVQFDSKVFVNIGPSKRLSFDSNMNITILFMVGCNYHVWIIRFIFVYIISWFMSIHLHWI